MNDEKVIQSSMPELIELEYAKIEKRRLFDQKPLPGLEGYVCTFDCLEHCPLAPDGGCFWDDPGIWQEDQIEYPEFTWWREDHEDLVEPEPEDPLQIRCPRCFSTKVTIGTYITCRNCGYNEVLEDFPENVGIGKEIKNEQHNKNHCSHPGHTPSIYHTRLHALPYR